MAENGRRRSKSDRKRTSISKDDHKYGTYAIRSHRCDGQQTFKTLCWTKYKLKIGRKKKKLPTTYMYKRRHRQREILLLDTYVH